MPNFLYILESNDILNVLTEGTIGLQLGPYGSINHVAFYDTFDGTSSTILPEKELSEFDVVFLLNSNTNNPHLTLLAGAQTSISDYVLNGGNFFCTPQLENTYDPLSIFQDLILLNTDGITKKYENPEPQPNDDPFAVSKIVFSGQTPDPYDEDFFNFLTSQVYLIIQTPEDPNNGFHEIYYDMQNIVVYENITLKPDANVLATFYYTDNTSSTPYIVAKKYGEGFVFNINQIFDYDSLTLDNYLSPEFGSWFRNWFLQQFIKNINGILKIAVKDTNNDNSDKISNLEKSLQELTNSRIEGDNKIVDKLIMEITERANCDQTICDKINEEINKMNESTANLEEKFAKFLSDSDSKRQQLIDKINLVENKISALKNNSSKDIIVSKSTNTLKVGDTTYTFNLQKVINGNTQKTLYFDNNNNSITEKEYNNILKQRDDEIYKYGVIHPTLGKKLEELNDEDTVNIIIYTSNDNINDFDFDSKELFTNDFEDYQRRTRHLNKPGKDNFSEIKLNFLRTSNGKLLNDKIINSNNRLGLIESTLPKSSILKLKDQNNIKGVFLQDDTIIEDINSQKDDTNATTVVDVQGWRGTNLRACVYEGTPGNADGLTGFALVNNNQDSDGQKSGIQEYYSPDLLPGNSSHATSVTSIITNRGSTINQRGFAPDSLIYSANTTENAALKWAVQGKECRVVNQSFHKSNEWNSTIPQEGDIYKDYLALNYPYPFITSASGNWSSASTSSEQGGSDGSLEIVNHKCYNCVTVGNTNDFNSSGPNGMRNSSVWKNPNSSHGDWELPEICANGTSVSFNGEARGSGTSFASPAVAGTALLIQNADNTLLYWPEGVRAILFAGAIHNVRGDNWFTDVINDVDGYDGCGAIDTLESIKITKKTMNGGKINRDNVPKSRGWDVGTLRDSDFTGSRSYISYYIAVPNILTNGTPKAQVRIALAWDAKVYSVIGIPIMSSLNLDHDIYLYNESGSLVSYSSSWDDSYEVINFEANRGEVYEIRIKRHSGTGSTWYGIAWTAGDGSFLKLKPELLNTSWLTHALTSASSNQTVDVAIGFNSEFTESQIDTIFENTMSNNSYVIDPNHIFRLLPNTSSQVTVKYNKEKLERVIRSSNKPIILFRLNTDTLLWEKVDVQVKDNCFIFTLSKEETLSFGIEETKIQFDSFIFNDVRVNRFEVITGSNSSIPSPVDFDFTVTPLTKDSPPSQLVLFYNKCKVTYSIVKDETNLNSYLMYNRNKYVPSDTSLLRYSKEGIVTQDYVKCRITITGDENNLKVSVEE